MRSHRTQYRVIYGDTDALGFAENGNYFRLKTAEAALPTPLMVCGEP